MIGIVIISENKESEELLKSLKRLLGRLRKVSSVVLGHKQSPQTMDRRLKQAIEEVQGDEGVILVTSLYGSSQCQTCMRHLERGQVALITGFNMPLLVKLITSREKMSFKELMSFVTKYGRKHVLSTKI